MNENIVRCAECTRDGQRSTVEVRLATVTAMASHSYHDEDGRLHHHDPNWHTTRYQCSHGHRFDRRIQMPCWCGWPNGGENVGSTEP